MLQTLAKVGIILESRKKVLIYVAITNLCAYFIFITNYLLNNHGMRFPWVNPYDQVFAGRWFTPFWFWLAGNGNAPVFSGLLFITLNIAAAAMVLELWGVRKLKPLHYFSLLTLITTYPAFTGGLYYHYASYMFSASIFLAAAAMLVSSKLTLMRITIGAALVTFTMATNQPSLSVFLTILSTYSLSLYITKVGTLETYIETFKKHILPRVIAFVLGVVLYKLSLAVFGIGESHATKTLSLSEFPEKFVSVFIVSFKHLLITQPEFSKSIKIALLFIIVSGVLITIIRALIAYRPKQKKQIVLFIAINLFLILSVVLSTKAMFLVSFTQDYYEYRYNFAMAYLYGYGTLVFLTVFSSFSFASFCSTALVMFVCLRFVQADLLRQGVLLRGQTHDLALANRIVYRIESLPNLRHDIKYVFVRVGDYNAY
jgi:hypothetical protein